MVSLPELDSEIGVLRFLKWKTRLLALDVIRASGRAHLNSIEDIPEPESLEPEVSTHLEQQDDAAVVKLALSKLSPRHREVLIASMYEEKATEEIAKQVGLSENATRQLIFRARAAFKKALIGDVDTTGMSASAILSVAARKAATEGKKVATAALTVIALAVMSISIWPTINGSRNSDNIAGPSAGAIDSEPGASRPGSFATPSDTPVASDPEASQAPAPSAPSGKITKKQARALLNDDDNLAGIFGAGGNDAVAVQNGRLFVVSAEPGLTTSFRFNSASSGDYFSNLVITFNIEGQLFTAVPVLTQELSFVEPNGLESYLVFATLGSLIDSNNIVWTDTPLASATVRIELLKQAGSLAVESATIAVSQLAR
jgi:RNA polymerase sigma-70 factor (ECF subfamily)